MMQTRYLRPDQERAVRIYMEKFGTDAGFLVIADFKKRRSLGSANGDHWRQSEDCWVDERSFADKEVGC